jgi:hypothetical protein
MTIRLRIVLQDLADLETVDPGKHEIEDEEIGSKGTDPVERLLTARDATHLVAVPFEVVPHQLLDIFLVIYDQDSFVRHTHQSFV